MTINKEDIKLFESRRLTDEGGGGAFGYVVTDGQVNSLFRDISRIGRTVGDVSMHKMFVVEYLLLAGWRCAGLYDFSPVMRGNSLLSLRVVCVTLSLIKYPARIPVT